MAKKSENTLSQIVGFIAWLTGVIIALAVAFALTDGTLVVPYLPPIISIIAGWIAVVTTLLGVLLAIIDRFSR